MNAKALRQLSEIGQENNFTYLKQELENRAKYGYTSYTFETKYDLPSDSHDRLIDLGFKVDYSKYSFITISW